MGGGKKSKAPPAPDYAAAAQAQGAADKATAQYVTALDRPSQTGPQGSVGWSLRPGADPNNPLPGDWTQTTTLSPQEQAIFGAGQDARLQATNMGNFLLSTGWNPKMPEFRPAGEMAQSNVNLPQNRLNQLGMLDESDNRFSEQGQQVRDALYEQMTRFNDERFGNAETAERTRLAQMGLQEGSKAYTNALSEFNRSKDESYQAAMLNSILAGGQEQSRMIADQLATRGSNVGLGQAQFGQDSTRYQLDQSERQAQATHDLNLAQQAAAQRQQRFQEEAYKRARPVNELSSISAALSGMGSGTQQQMPQFSPFAQATPFNAPDMLGATNAQYNAAMNQYNAGQSQKGGLLGAGAGVLGSFLGGM